MRLFSGEKFREVLTATFGLENWLYCRQRFGLRGNGVIGETMGMSSLNRHETRIEDRTCHTQVLNNGTTTEVIAHEDPEEETDPLKNTVRFARDNGNLRDVHIV